MPKEYRIVLINVVICSIFFACGFFIADHAHADSSAPGLPFQLFGKVMTENGSVVPNASVEVSSNGTVIAKSLTNKDGEYGFAPSLLIIPDPEGDLAGKNLELSVNGLSVPTFPIFEPGVLKELDLVSSITSPFPTESLAKPENSIQIQPSSPTSTSSVLKIGPMSRKSSSSTAEIIYTTPVFHIRKHKPVDVYLKDEENKRHYPHSKLVGIISFILVIAILSWVYLQNYLYTRKQKF